MKMEGDKNSGVMDKPKAFNQPDGEGTHARLSKHIKKDANEAVRSSTAHRHARTHTQALFKTLFRSFPFLLSPPISSLERLQASGCKRLQSAGPK